MWALVTFPTATWLTWAVVSNRTTALSARLITLWTVSTVVVAGSLYVGTSELVDHGPWSPLWALWGAVVAIVGVLMVVDLDVQLLPREVSLPSFAIVVVALTIIEPPSDLGRWGPIVGAVVMTAIAAILRFASRGSLGMGDVLVSPLLGAVVGWFDPWAVVTVWVIAAFVGGVAAMFGMWRGASRHRLVAYGPFLFFGTAVAVIGTVI